MPTDLLPFSAFSLESSRPSAHDMSEAQTLTLRLADLPQDTGNREQMNGTLVLSPASFVDECVLRAAVIPGDGTPLTLTF
jgi:hypothetical protein